MENIFRSSILWRIAFFIQSIDVMIGHDCQSTKCCSGQVMKINCTVISEMINIDTNYNWS